MAGNPNLDDLIAAAHRPRHTAETTVTSPAPNPKKLPLMLGHIEIPYEVEAMHTVTSGGTGAGKSSAAFQKVEIFRKRGNPIIAMDRNGELMRRFYKPGDIIVHPFDRRSVRIDILREMRYTWDCEAIAAAAVPDRPGENAFFYTRTQSFFADMLRQQDAKGEQCQTQAFTRYLLFKAPVYKEGSEGKMSLQEFMQDTPSAHLFDKSADKALNSTLDILKLDLRWLVHMTDSKQEIMSLRDFVGGLGPDTTESRAVWIVYTDATFKALRTAFGLMVSTIITSMIDDLPESTGNHTQIMLDELASLGKIEALPAGFNLLRKVGGCLHIYIQSIAQLGEIYGQEAARAIIDNAGTLLMMRSNDPTTNKYFSDLIGEDEVEEQTHSKNKNTDIEGNVTHGESTSFSKRIKPHILTSEFGKQNARSGLLRITGTEHVATKIRVPVCQLPNNAIEPFLPRTGLELSGYAKRKASLEQHHE